MTMRIAECVSIFPPCHGGMGYVCYYNALGLARRGHDVTVFTMADRKGPRGGDPADSEAYKDGDLEVVRIEPALRWGDGGLLPRLYRRLKGFDIVHLHYPFYGGAEPVFLASLLRGQRYFLTYHMDVYGESWAKRLVLKAYDLIWMKRILARAGGIGAVKAEHLKRARAAPFIDWSKVVEIPNGVDPERFRPREKDRSLLERHGLEGKVVVLFVGNLQPFKGLHLLMEAVGGMEDDRVVLLVVGGGYGEARYRRRAVEQGLEGRVLFAGPRSPQEDLPRYYNVGDLLVLPSTHSESFGLVVLEAMASAKPVIVSALPGPSQLVEDGRNGYVVEVGNVEALRGRISALARDEALRRSMGERARKKVLESYTWDGSVDRLEAVLRNLAAS